MPVSIRAVFTLLLLFVSFPAWGQSVSRTELKNTNAAIDVRIANAVTNKLDKLNATATNFTAMASASTTIPLIVQPRTGTTVPFQRINGTNGSPKFIVNEYGLSLWHPEYTNVNGGRFNDFTEDFNVNPDGRYNVTKYRGYNLNANGLNEIATEPAFGEGLESHYWDGTRYVFEWHHVWASNAYQKRLYGLLIAKNGGYATHAWAGDQYQWYRDSGQTNQWILATPSAAGGTIDYLGWTQLRFSTNNNPPFRMLNAANNAFLDLPYINNSNQLYISQSLLTLGENLNLISSDVSLDNNRSINFRTAAGVSTPVISLSTGNELRFLSPNNRARFVIGPGRSFEVANNDESLVRFVVNEDGTGVGVNTANPASALDVPGQGRFGSLTVTGAFTTPLSSNTFLVQGPGGIMTTGIFSTGLVYDPATRTLVSNGGAGASTNADHFGAAGNVLTIREAARLTNLVSVGQLLGDTAVFSGLVSSSDSFVGPAFSGVTPGGLILESGGAGLTIQFGINGSEKARLESSGNLGLGTFSPQRPLEINNATGGTMRLTYNDTIGTSTTYADQQVNSDGNLVFRPSGGYVIPGLASNTFTVIGPGGILTTGIFGSGLSYNVATRTLTSTGSGSGSVTTLKEEGSQVGDADIVVLDFLGADFDLTESPDTEVNIVIAAAIARDSELVTGTNDAYAYARLMTNAVVNTNVGSGLSWNGSQLSATASGSSVTPFIRAGSTQTNFNILTSTNVMIDRVADGDTTLSFTNSCNGCGGVFTLTNGGAEFSVKPGSGTNFIAWQNETPPTVSASVSDIGIYTIHLINTATNILGWYYPPLGTAQLLVGSLTSAGAITAGAAGPSEFQFTNAGTGFTHSQLYSNITATRIDIYDMSTLWPVVVGTAYCWYPKGTNGVGNVLWTNGPCSGAAAGDYITNNVATSKVFTNNGVYMATAGTTTTNIDFAVRDVFTNQLAAGIDNVGILFSNLTANRSAQIWFINDNVATNTSITLPATVIGMSQTFLAWSNSITGIGVHTMNGKTNAYILSWQPPRTTNNFVSGQLYTNTGGCFASIEASIGLTNALSTDVARMSLWLDEDGDGTFEYKGKQVRLNGLIALAGVENLFASDLPPGARFTFTNDSGVATIENNSSRWRRR